MRKAAAGTGLDGAVPRVPLGTGSARPQALEPRRPGRDRADGSLRGVPGAGHHQPAALRGRCRARDLHHRTPDHDATRHGVPAQVKSLAIAAALWGGLTLQLAAQATSLTIYNDGRVLVRRTVALAVPKGTSEQRLALGPLDPSTLFALDSGVAIAD